MQLSVGIVQNIRKRTNEKQKIYRRRGKREEGGEEDQEGKIKRRGQKKKHESHEILSQARQHFEPQGRKIRQSRRGREKEGEGLLLKEK